MTASPWPRTFPGWSSFRGMAGGGDASPPSQCGNFPRQAAFLSNSPHIHTARTQQNPEDGRAWARPSTEPGVYPSPLRGAPSSRFHVYSPCLRLERECNSFPLELITTFFTVLCGKQPGSTEPPTAFTQLFVLILPSLLFSSPSYGAHSDLPSL